MWEAQWVPNGTLFVTLGFSRTDSMGSFVRAGTAFADNPEEAEEVLESVKQMAPTAQ